MAPAETGPPSREFPRAEIVGNLSALLSIEIDGVTTSTGTLTSGRTGPPGVNAYAAAGADASDNDPNTNEGKIVVAWETLFPSDRGVGTFSGYQVWHRQGSSGGFTVARKGTTDRTHTITGLADGTYQVIVRAYNVEMVDHDNDPITPAQAVEHHGFFSEYHTVTVDADHTGRPGKPTGGVITPGVGSLTVEWEPPTGGGSAVYAYQVRHRRGDYAFSDGGGDWTRSPRLYPRQTRRMCIADAGSFRCDNPRSYVIPNLIGGRDYDVAIRARNANGWGDWLSVGEFNLPNGFPPVLQSAAVNGSTLTLTFDRSLDADSKPSTSVFSVSAGGSDQTPTGVGISGNTVTLTLGTAVTSGQTVTVSYARPNQTPLQHNDAQGPSFSNQAVTNNTP